MKMRFEIVDFDATKVGVFHALDATESFAEFAVVVGIFEVVGLYLTKEELTGDEMFEFGIICGGDFGKDERKFGGRDAGILVDFDAKAVKSVAFFVEVKLE